MRVVSYNGSSFSYTISTFPLKQWGTANRGTNIKQKLNNPPLANLN